MKIIGQFVTPIVHALKTASKAKQMRMSTYFTYACNAKLLYLYYFQLKSMHGTY